MTVEDPVVLPVMVADVVRLFDPEVVTVVVFDALAVDVADDDTVVDGDVFWQLARAPRTSEVMATLRRSAFCWHAACW